MRITKLDIAGFLVSGAFGAVAGYSVGVWTWKFWVLLILFFSYGSIRFMSPLAEMYRKGWDRL